jgi:hypothetical protein
MAPVVEHLPSKHEALNSVLSTTLKKKKSNVLFQDNLKALSESHVYWYIPVIQASLNCIARPCLKKKKKKP